ncbi:hypothetical protein, partial [uncultured Caldilinea sp.]|uniref:hypothetical protein n=1 Tax=uncultured Caldilinea sp. TaxID=435295 RepID=UPI00260E6CEA
AAPTMNPENSGLRRRFLPLSQHWERGPGGEGLCSGSWVRLGCAAASRTYDESREFGAATALSPPLPALGEGVGGEGLVPDFWVRLGCAAASRTYDESRECGAATALSPPLPALGEEVGG